MQRANNESGTTGNLYQLQVKELDEEEEKMEEEKEEEEEEEGRKG